MSSNNRVLVVIDPESDARQTSLQRGEWLAQQLGLGLDLLLCDYEQYLSGNRVVDSPGLSELRKNAIEANRVRLEGMAEASREKGLDVVVSSVWDTPLDEGIARHVIRTEPEYVVKETHYHSQLGRALFAHTDWNLVRYCPCPLWLAKPHDWPENPAIIASVDPMHADDKHADLDKQILDQASAIAGDSQGKLHVFHSFLSVDHIAAGPIEAGGIVDASLGTNIENAHRDSVEKLLGNYAVADDRRHVVAGHPQTLLPKLADEVKADLVVLGSIARNPLQTVIVGSTAEKVLDKLPCDLLIVKPSWFESKVSTKPSRFSERSTDVRDVPPAKPPAKPDRHAN